MKRMIFNLKRLMTIALLLLSLYSMGQNQIDTDFKWNAVKVFNLDFDDVYNIFIDTLNAANGEAAFCFQTNSGKLIKTDIKGVTLSTVDNPDTFFTFYNGDTLIVKDNSIINGEGKVIHEFGKKNYPEKYSYITASPIGLLIFNFSNYFYELEYGYVALINPIVDYEPDLKFNTLSGVPITGLCYSDGFVFAIQANTDNMCYLTRRIVDNSKKQSEDNVPIEGTAGIAGYNGYLYVYSNTDKALYRLETPEGHGIEALKEKPVPDNHNHNETIYPLYLDYVVIPDRFFVKKSTGVTQDYLISLLEDEFNGNYQIEGWIGDDICKVIVDDSLIDLAVTKLLNNDSILVARRIYADRGSYEHYLNGAHIKLDEIEMCIFSEIAYGIRNGYSQNQMDSIADVYGLVNTPNPYNSKNEGMFGLSKTTDIFEMSRTLYEIGCFTYIQPNMYMQVVLLNPTLAEEKEKQPVQVLETKYYNITGQTTDSPSGLILVVTRYSDGTVSTEKKLF